MPQAQLPIFPEGMTHITNELGFVRSDDDVTYYTGHFPVFRHDVADLRSFRMITSHFVVAGIVKQCEVYRAFGVTSISVKRAVRLYREQGIVGFYAPRRGRGPAVLTEDNIKQLEELMDAGVPRADAARQLGLKPNTVAKAVAAGKVREREPVAKGTNEAPSSSKSERSTEDSSAAMGMGATDMAGRVGASLGLAGPAEPEFASTADVPKAGVLVALPALLSVGLLRGNEKHFKLPRGFYHITSIFLLLAFLALARVKSIERLRYCSPGEWGKVLGLDRAPEVRTLRNKLKILTEGGDEVREWSADLCREWMQHDPEATGLFYIDGHVRVYHGSQTPLPRRYVSRQRLCLRGTTDYWVNAFDAQPFFVVSKPIDPGLIKVLTDDIVPQLLKDAPELVSEQELKENPLLHRFTLVFDREGYSPAFFAAMKKKRIACLTYRRSPGKDWPLEEFSPVQVTLSNGERIRMHLAERGVFLSSGKIWVREIRRLSETDHQTPIVTTNYTTDQTLLAPAMFARWSQENFFRYMLDHYDLDHLATYALEETPENLKVVNPAHRTLDSTIRKKTSALNRARAKFGALNLNDTIQPKKVKQWEKKKAALLVEIQAFAHEIAELKKERKATPRHIKVSELPPDQTFKQLHSSSKHFVDTIKMIAYRAETALVNILRDASCRDDEARSLLLAVFSNEADLIPDRVAGTLTVRLHHLANHASADAIRHLCSELNATATVYPDTNLKLVYEMGSSQIPADQVV